MAKKASLLSIYSHSFITSSALSNLPCLTTYLAAYSCYGRLSVRLSVCRSVCWSGGAYVEEKKLKVDRIITRRTTSSTLLCNVLVLMYKQRMKEGVTFIYLNRIFCSFTSGDLKTTYFTHNTQLPNFNLETATI